MALHLHVQHDVEEIMSMACIVRDQIWFLGTFISEQQEEIDKLLNLFVGIVGSIVTATFTVQVVDRAMHCATSWTLPVLMSVAYVGTIAAIAPIAYRQFIAFDIKHHLVQQLDRLVDVSREEGAVLMRNDPPLFNTLCNIQMEVNLRGGKSLELWCATRAGFLLGLTIFSLFLLISSKRLLC